MKLTYSVLACAVAALMAGSATAQQHAADVTGRWRVSITFDSGQIAGTFDLTQEGERVIGRFTAPFTGDVPVEGEMSHGTLTLSGSTTGGPHPGEQLDFAGEMKTNTEMSGTLSWQPGNFAWKAERSQ